MKLFFSFFKSRIFFYLIAICLGIPAYAQDPASAKNYIFPGDEKNLPNGCKKISGEEYIFLCQSLKLERNETITITSSKVVINFSGDLLLEEGSAINYSGVGSLPQLNMEGLTVRRNLIVNANIFANKSIVIDEFSEIRGNIETAGGNIKISKNTRIGGRIRGNSNSSSFTDIVIDESSEIRGDIESAGGNIKISKNTRIGGSIRGNLNSSSRMDIVIDESSEICGDIEAAGGNIKISNNAHIGGSIRGNPNFLGRMDVILDPGSTVGGDVRIVLALSSSYVIMSGAKIGGDVKIGVGSIVLKSTNVGGRVSAFSLLGSIYIDNFSKVNDTSLSVQKGCASNTGVDHYELSVPTSSIACVATAVTVTACANNSNPCTSIASTVNGSATLASTGGSISAATLVAGVGTATLRYPNAVDRTAVTVSLTSASTVAASAATCLGGSCATIFNMASFIFSKTANSPEVTLPTQVAGASSGTYFLRAVKSNTSTQACQAALTGQQSVNLAYLCNNPSTCHAADMMSVNGGTATTISGNSGNNSTGVARSTQVNLIFDSNGNAPLTFVYSDVGQIKLSASKAASGLLLTDLNGSSNAFVVKPGGFVLSAIQQTAQPQLGNPGAANASGIKFIKAGEAFSVTVRATTTSTSGVISTTPSYGRESAPESVKLNASLVAPAGGAAGTLTGDFGLFSNGVATGTAFAWNEVGIMTLTPRITSYLGVSGDVTGTVSGNVGRFTPNHFITEVAEQACLDGGFTYSGQPFKVVVSAKSGGIPSVVTQNYTGLYARDLTLSDANATGLAALSPADFLASTVDKGVATLTTPRFTFTNAQTVPTALKLRATDTDGVTSVAQAEGSVLMRSGRIRVSNAYGSEKLDLPIPLNLEYWTGGGWVKNSADTCTLLQSQNFGFTFPTVTGANQLKACDTAVPLSGVGVAPNYSFSLSKPVAGLTGWVDITLNLNSTGSVATQCRATGGPGTADVPANVPWLQHNWTGGVGSTDNPKARVTFGLHKSRSPHIYRRENH
jgi:MSHA biogenesis protein MshQ